MSKLITDSKVLTDLLIDEEGIIENTNAYFLIERLKEAVLSCSELNNRVRGLFRNEKTSCGY